MLDLIIAKGELVVCDRIVQTHVSSTNNANNYVRREVLDYREGSNIFTFVKIKSNDINTVNLHSVPSGCANGFQIRVHFRKNLIVCKGLLKHFVIYTVRPCTSVIKSSVNLIWRKQCANVRSVRRTINCIYVWSF